MASGRLRSLLGAQRLACSIRASLALTLVLAAGCANTASDTDEPVTLMHWWGTASESTPLNEVLRRSNVPVTSISYVSAAKMREDLEKKLIERKPPRLFVANGGLDLLRWGDQGANVLQPLGEVAPVDWISDVPCEVKWAVTGANDGSHEPAVFAVPLNIHRNNVLFYNPALFERAKVSIPSPEEFSKQDFSSLLDLCDTLKERVAAFSTAGEDSSGSSTTSPAAFDPMVEGATDAWILALLAFENVLVAQSHSNRDNPAELYESVLRGKLAYGDSEASDQSLENFISDVRRLFACFKTDDTVATTWEDAGIRFANGQVAMMIGGDWTHAVIQSAAPADFEYVTIPTPGTSRVFVFTADVMTMVRGLPDARRARAVLDHFASLKGQAEFSRLKGSIPARQSAVNLDDMDWSDAAKASIADFAHQRRTPAMSHFVPNAYRELMEDALQTLLSNDDDGPLRARLGNLRKLLTDIKPIGYPLCLKQE